MKCEGCIHAEYCRGSATLEPDDCFFKIIALPKTYKKEDNKMNATSTENFHDIIAIDFELQTFPNPDVEDKFIVSATNRDDIFCFVFEGPDLSDTLRKTGLFSGWEKDMKIRELEEEVGIVPNKIEFVGKIVLSPGFSNEYIYMYFVDDYTDGNISFDEDEDLDSFDLSVEEALEYIYDGKIYDAKSVSLIMMLKDRLLKK